MVADARLRRDVLWNLVPVALLAITGLGSQFAIGYRWGAGELGVFNLVTTALLPAVIEAAQAQFSTAGARSRVAIFEEAPATPAGVAATCSTATPTALFVLAYLPDCA